jgi:glycosyltransferase involved in cell wall biosynthesis
MLNKRPVKVAVLTNWIPSYRRPVFEALFKDKSLKLKLFVSSPLEKSDSLAVNTLPLHYSKGLNLPYKTYHIDTNVNQFEYLHIPFCLPFDLLFSRPNFIISGEFGLRSLVAMTIARLRGVPFVLWSEEIAESAKGISNKQRILRNILIPRATACLAWGAPAVNYLKSFHVPDNKIFYCAQAVDNRYWMDKAATYSKSDLKAKLGFQGKVFISVGRLVARKGFDILLQAWSALPDRVKSNNSLVIVGAGEDEQKLRQLASDNGMHNVYFVGYKTAEELPEYYAAADVFVFPSLVDVWGLVVNEAMACGLPVLASKYAGASQELIDSAEVGEVFDPLDIEAFTALLVKWSSPDIEIAPAIPQKAVSRLNFDVTVSAFQKAIKTLPVKKDSLSG